MNDIRFAIIALLGAGSLLAEPPRRGEGGAPKGEEGGRSFGRFFEGADSDGDGKVSAEEFAALERLSKIPADKRDEIFRRFDKNGDGSIQREEMRPSQRPDGGGRPFPRLHELDSDKDGKVSFEEFAGGPFGRRMPQERLKQFFARLDNNGDGSLSPEDMRDDRRRPHGHDPRRIIEMLDKDGDGKLSLEEFSRAPWLLDKGEDERTSRFTELDRNGDGLVGLRELSSAGPKGPRTPGNKGPGQKVPKGPEAVRDGGHRGEEP